MKFRLQALAHLGEPEELDIAPRLVDPRAWIAAAVLLVAVVAALVWSFVAHVPRTVTANGVLAPAGGLLTVQAPAQGVVTAVSVQPGAAVTVGEQVGTVLDPQQRAHPVSSPFAGQVVALAAQVGQPVSSGSTVLTLRASSGAALVAQLFVSSDKAATIGPGMPVQLSVESAPSAAFGLLRGTVQAVSTQTITPDQAMALLGNEILVHKLTSSGPQRLVTVALRADRSTRSGYSWTSGGGPPFALPAQSLLSGTVQIGTQKPIDFVFGH